MTVFELDNVSKSLTRGQHRLPVLQDVSLTVAAGDVVSVVGAREQGKTTLLQIAAGRMEPDEGSGPPGRPDTWCLA
jgi:predicted ABC-type transport system involved in lysophospholipase L1 biosynthesis ATPase subunit